MSKKIKPLTEEEKALIDDLSDEWADEIQAVIDEEEKQNKDKKE